MSACMGVALCALLHGLTYPLLGHPHSCICIYTHQCWVGYKKTVCRLFQLLDFSDCSEAAHVSKTCRFSNGNKVAMPK